MMGEGDAKVGEELLSGDIALSRVGLVPLELQAKEGLALINGTQYTVAVGSLCLHCALRLLKASQVAVAMSVDALRGTVRSFSDRISDARPHEGQRRVARNLRSLLEGSAIAASHAGCAGVQDAYTLRCVPQVLGAVMDALHYVRGTMEVEINSGTDNPPWSSNRGRSSPAGTSTVSRWP